MPPPHPILARRFAAILTSAACRRIDYWLGGLHVTGGGLATVARALELGGADGKGITITVSPTDANIAASYYTGVNELNVPSESWASTDRFEKLSIVHEAIHALRDMQGVNVMWNNKPYRPKHMTDESAAYLGGCLYDIYWQQDCLGTVSESPPWLADRKAAIHAVAYKLALASTKRQNGSPIPIEDLHRLNTTYRQSARKAGINPAISIRYDGIPMPK